MTGFFRTGTWFAYSQFNIVPDMVTFAKGITCSYLPLGGVITSEKIARFYDDNPFPCTLTNGAHPAGCAAGLAAMDEYKRLDIAGQLKITAPLMAKMLRTLKGKYKCAGAVRSIGLLGVIELVNGGIAIGKDSPHLMSEIMQIFYKTDFLHIIQEI